MEECVNLVHITQNHKEMVNIVLLIIAVSTKSLHLMDLVLPVHKELDQTQVIENA